MERKTKIGITAASLLAAGAGVAGIAAAGGGNDSEAPITGTALERASDAALAETGEGQVSDTEVGDEESYYEVETLDDGSETDVQVNRNYEVVGTEAEDGSEEESGSDD
jgi:hypothetical protein